MPRLTITPPKYRHHKASGQAVVTLNSRDCYLGKHGSPESKAAYERLVGEWLANSRQRHPEDAPDQPVIDELVLAYLEYAKSYYVKDGQPTISLHHIRDTLALVHQHHGALPVSKFGPLALKQLRDHMLEDGAWCRSTINKAIGTIKRVFKWGAENELVPPTAYQGLQAVAGFRRGRSKARESEPVKPVPDAMIDPVLARVSPQVRAMIELQRLTGMRPGEVVTIRAKDLETNGRIWTYRPASHKTEYLGRHRVIYLGPRAQEILTPWLKPELNAYLFSPAEAEQVRNSERRQQRKTPMTPSQAKRGAKRTRRRRPGDRYTRDSYRWAVYRACDTAFPPPAHLAKHKDETNTQWQARLTDDQRTELKAWRRAHRWHPNQLRHNAATWLRKQYGLDAARVILGHSSPAVTEVYAELDHAKAMQIMAEVGSTGTGGTGTPTPRGPRRHPSSTGAEPPQVVISLATHARSAHLDARGPSMKSYL